MDSACSASNIALSQTALLLIEASQDHHQPTFLVAVAILLMDRQLLLEGLDRLVKVLLNSSLYTSPRLCRMRPSR